MQKLKLFFLTIMATISLSPLVSVVSAQTPNNSATDNSVNAVGCGGQLNLNTNCKRESGKADDQINGIIRMAVRIFQVIVGIIATFFVIYGGLTYITSGGSDAGIKTAKNTILYAAIGLVVVGIAQILVTFVLNRVAETTGQ